MLPALLPAIKAIKVGDFLSRNWEWGLIVMLLVAGWMMNERIERLHANAATAKAQIETALAATVTANEDRDHAVDLAARTKSAARDALLVLAKQNAASESALRARERSLHELQRNTQRATAAVAAAPDDGCLDRPLPDDLLRQLRQATGAADHSGSSPAATAAPAELGAAPAASVRGDELASFAGVHASTPGGGRSLGDRQDDGKNSAWRE